MNKNMCRWGALALTMCLFLAPVSGFAQELVQNKGAGPELKLEKPKQLQDSEIQVTRGAEVDLSGEEDGAEAKTEDKAKSKKKARARRRQRRR